MKAKGIETAEKRAVKIAAKIMQAKELAINVAYWRELPPPPNVGDVCNGR